MRKNRYGSIIILNFTGVIDLRIEETEHNFHIAGKISSSSKRRKKRRRIGDRKDFRLEINKQYNL